MNTRAQTFSEGDTSRDAALHAAFRHSVEIAQPSFSVKDGARDGTIRTSSRMNWILVNIPMDG